MKLELAGEADFDGFRHGARGLLARRVAPDDVQWSVAGSAAPALFAGEHAAEQAVAGRAPQAPVQAQVQAQASGATVAVPPAFVELCRQVVLHSDPTRFALMYRLLWRLQHEPALRHDALDPELMQARRMAQAVRRDMHKMKAFVRFRQVARGEGQPPLHVAWFEPGHHIVEAVAPFFSRRFTAMAWAILSPERCVRWDGEQLHLGPGARRQDAPSADAGEALWLTYYQSIFNPARLKLRAMEKEMPRRYWPNLPEARLISGLAAQAGERTAGMVDSAPTPARATARALPVASRPLSGPVIASDVDTGGTAARERRWATLRDAAAGCRECPLGALATQTVWGQGPLTAPLMLVGEQPGDQEDLQGLPFVGPAGQLLNRAMAQLNWDRAVAYVTNAVKHFKYEPRGKRRVHKTPAQREADACEHWLASEITLVQPQAIVALGATAARQLLGRPVAVMRERGQWLQRADGLPVLVTLHPSALLRTDAADRDAAYAAWLDDLRLADAYARRPAAGQPISPSAASETPAPHVPAARGT